MCDATTSDWPEDAPVPLDHPEIPPLILEAVLQYWQPGYVLHRMVTKQGLEWWLLDTEGGLIEAFWLN
ncbi:hypothetical protein U737_05345 [Methylomonas sp. LW13]|uniref:hypothetical protein n=1 Tax=unclassified Methylomonas TaxID=2608980 RepID=UPI00051B0E6F|nr:MULTISPECIES: hypothetical protein [unclassified Methylomonas]PKD41018.1 hypothetical protein CWO84_07115 [Methylomonas sp. Kb3]QBC26392.1 hypothetical protein U737_05345 [Methylomonas sp. LW13]